MTSPTQAVLDNLAAMKLDPHVPKRPSAHAVKVRYCTGWRQYVAWLIREDADAGTARILFYDDTERSYRVVTVESRRLIR
jgi:hypothetical protein